MKKILLLVSIAFVIMSVSESEAWQVDVKNSCDSAIKLEVGGDYLISHPVVCDVIVGQGQRGVCRLPGAICPVYVQVFVEVYRQPGHWMPASSAENCGKFGWQGCCCWNLNVEVVKEDNRCKPKYR